MPLLDFEGEFAPAIGEVAVNKILRIHGYKNPDEVRAAIRNIAKRVINISMPLFEPVIYYRQIPIQVLDQSRLTLACDNISFHNPAFSRVLSSCTDVMVFLLTLGKKLDKTSVELQENDQLLEALFLESVSWIAIENATRVFVTALRQKTNKNDCQITSRLAPGYGDWPLDEQQELFRLFQDWKLQISLTDKDCMIPKMSRSGLYGIRAIE